VYLPPVLRTLQGESTFLRSGDEIIEPGLPAHKRVFVGIMGAQGENLVDAPEGQSAHLVHLQLIPNWHNLRIGERGPETV